jgi:hypothetical protein
MVAVMVLLFAAMLLVRRRQLLNKKSALSNINGKQKNYMNILVPQIILHDKEEVF